MNKPLTPSVTDPNRIPYQKSQPRDMRPDMVIHDVLGHSGQSDPRLWVPLTEHISVRPLQFNVTVGQYTHVMRVTKAGLIARHRHAGCARSGRAASGVLLRTLARQLMRRLDLLLTPPQVGAILTRP